MGIVVQKYGGSSVGDVDRLRRVARRITQARRDGNAVVVVVSAQGDTTDDLISRAFAISPRPPKRELDMLLATGEQMSVALLAIAVAEEGEEVISLTGQQGGIRTNSLHTKAKILRVDPARIRRELDEDRIVIVAGFQGISDTGDITTLGRGGSDTTAVAVAAGLGAEVCEIYTDVDGVYSADPRLVPDARRLDEISYDEMLEMASLGAVVLQPRAVELAAAWGVTIRVLSSFAAGRGTIVKGGTTLERQRVVSGVTHDINVAKVVMVDVPDMPGVAHTVFSALASDGINVDMIVQTTKKEGKYTDLLFSICRDDLLRTREIVGEVVRRIGAQGVEFDGNVAKVSIVGAGMMGNPGVAATMFGALAQKGINIDVISTSEIKISCLIDASRVKEAVSAIHSAFALGDTSSGPSL